MIKKITLVAFICCITFASEPQVTKLNPEPMVHYGDHMGQDFEFWHLSSAALTPAGELYVVDQKQQMVFKYDLAGNLLKKIGRQGAGPGEFEQPTDALFVNNELWVVDFMNAKILVFKDDEFSHDIKSNKKSSFKFLDRIDETIYVSDFYYTKGLGSILKMNLQGETIDTITSIDVPDPRSMRYAALWRGYQLIGLQDKSLLLGYLYDNLIVKASTEGETLKVISMEDYYEPTTDGTPPDVSPTSLLVSAFAAGPNNTVLMTICDHTIKRNDCSILYQFDADLTKVLNRWNLKDYIRFMKYDRDKGLLITGTQTELKIYEMK